MKKRIVIGVLVVAVFLSGFVTASAFSGRRTLDAYFNNIKVVVNGREADLRDANGNPVEPFIVNGTTYLPLRAALNAITGGAEAIEWDPVGYRVLIGDCRTGKVGFHELKAFYGQSAVSPGKSFLNRGTEITPFNSFLINATGTFALDGRYARLTGSLCVADVIGGGYDGKVQFFGDDVLLGEYSHIEHTYPRNDIDISLVGVNTLKIIMWGNWTHFYNIEIERLD